MRGDPGGPNVNVYARSGNAVLVCLLIFLIAIALGGLVRRILTRDRPGSRLMAVALREIAASVVRPLLVLALTVAVVGLGLRRL